MTSSHRAAFFLAMGAATMLAACDASHSVHSAAPAGTVAANYQPRPSKPLFDTPIIASRDVLPAAKADSKEPLPPATPLPSPAAAAPSAGAGDAEGGGVNPAAGMAAAVTDSQGAAHDADGKQPE